MWPSSFVQIFYRALQSVCIVMCKSRLLSLPLPFLLISTMSMSYDDACEAAVVPALAAPPTPTRTPMFTPTPTSNAIYLSSDPCVLPSSRSCCQSLNNTINADTNTTKTNLCKSAVLNSNVNKFGRLESSQLLLPNDVALPAASNRTLFKCRYDLQGAANERVQIKFLDFFLPPAIRNSTYAECALNNSLQVLSLVRGKYEPTEILCGAFLPKPIMSVGPNLVLQFVGQVPDAKISFYGFRAEYRFLRNFGITTGEQIDNECSYVYNSTMRKVGWFSSPNFPGYYPHNIICNYYFYAEMGEHVNIQFTHFDVEGIENCEHMTASDFVEFSNFMSIDRKFGKFCGKHEKLTVRSDDRFFRVKFSSNDRFDKTGFYAMYDFENESLTQANISSMQSYTSSAGISDLCVCCHIVVVFPFLMLIFNI